MNSVFPSREVAAMFQHRSLNSPYPQGGSAGVWGTAHSFTQEEAQGVESRLGYAKPRRRAGET